MDGHAEISPDEDRRVDRFTADGIRETIGPVHPVARYLEIERDKGGLSVRRQPQSGEEHGGSVHLESPAFAPVEPTLDRGRRRPLAIAIPHSASVPGDGTLTTKDAPSSVTSVVCAGRIAEDDE